MKEVNAPNCGRENDLIGFLYGELNEVEALTFQRHLHECVACSAEFASFTEVRESVVAWRNESLGGVVSPFRSADSDVARASQAKPSAIAALREFFNLSPLWMKGAVAFAAVLLCVFAVLAVAGLRDKQPGTRTVGPITLAYSQQEIEAIVQRRMQEELERMNSRGPLPTLHIDGTNSSHGTSRGEAVSRTTVANNVAGQRARRPLSKTEREQLAADLRLVSSKSESDLDLLDDRINQ